MRNNKWNNLKKFFLFPKKSSKEILMKNTFVVIMSIAVFSFSLLTWEVLADDIKGIDQVKTCLAMVYFGQMGFHKKNQR